MFFVKNSSQPIAKLLILLVSGCITSMTATILAPVFPDLVQELKLDPQWAGMVLSIHTITIALFIPLMGIMADTVGQSKVLIFSLFSYGVLGSSGAFLNDLNSLLITRGFLGIASGGISASCIGILSNMYQEEARLKMLGYATSLMTTATVFAPLLGGVVGSKDWRFVFFLYGLSIPVAILAIFLISDQSNHHDSSLTKIPITELFNNIRNFEVIRSFIIITFASCIMYSVMIYAPLWFKESIDADSKLNGIILAARAIGIVIFSASSASLFAKSIGKNQTIALGFILMAFTLITIPWLVKIPLILLIALIFGLGFGILIPNVYNNLAELALPELRASLMAIGTGFNSLGKFIAPIFLGGIWKYWGLTQVFYVTAFVAILFGFYLLFMPNKPISNK